MSFEDFSKDIYLLILQHCSGRDIVNFTSLNPKLYELKFHEKFIGKLRLIFDYGQNDEEIAEVLAFAKGKNFVNLRIKRTDRHPEMQSKTRCWDDPGHLIHMTDEALNTITNLEISIKTVHMSEDQFCELVKIFLPRLDECCVKLMSLAFDKDYTDDDIRGPFHEPKLPIVPERYPLRVLKLIDVEGKFTKFFFGCKQLETFEYKAKNYLYRNYVSPFIMLQEELKNLHLDYTLNEKRECLFYPHAIGSTWKGSKFQLEKLKLVGAVLTNQQSELKFFAEQKNLKSLQLFFYNKIPYKAMRIICRMEKLKKLVLVCSSQDPGSPRKGVDPICFVVDSRLKNLSVETLYIIDHVKIAPKLIDIFIGVTVLYNISTCDLIVKDHNRLIDLKLKDKYLFVNFIYSPPQPPLSVIEFEENMMIFAKRNFRQLNSIVIAENFENFGLSMNFIEALVCMMPDIRMVFYNQSTRIQLHNSLPSTSNEECDFFESLTE